MLAGIGAILVFFGLLSLIKGGELAEGSQGLFSGDLSVVVEIELGHEYFELIRYELALELLRDLVGLDDAISVLVEPGEQLIDHRLH